MALSAKGSPMPVAKRCDKCRGVKPIGGFTEDKSKDDGSRGICKVCYAAKVRAKRAEDPEKHREESRRWRADNPEKATQVSREYMRRWRDANREESRRRNRAWKTANPHKQAEYNNKRRARKLGGEHAPYDRVEIFERWGWMCGYGCGQPAEHLDHITPLSRGGADATWNLIPSCAEENLSKNDRTLAEWAATF